jgi:NADPH:quinone reductase-like Zn-dependent oxidoreductase
MSDSMHAVRGHRRGGAERLRYEVAPRPTPGAGEMLVAVYAAAITSGELDWDATWTDRFDGSGSPRVPTVLSKEVSGVVAALGPETADATGAADLAVGEAVYGLIPFLRDGAAAEYAAVPALALARKPPSLDHEHAAALPLAGLPAWQALVRHGSLTTGQHVLVHGAAGGVGSLTVQLATAPGARVTATARAADADFVRGLGAERVVDCTAQRFEDQVEDVDQVQDTVGGDTRARSWRVLRPGGVLVSITAPPAPPQGTRARGAFFVVEPDRAGLEQLTALVAAGRLAPQLDRVLPLQEAPQAYAELAQHHRGKVVLRVG